MFVEDIAYTEDRARIVAVLVDYPMQYAPSQSDRSPTLARSLEPASLAGSSFSPLGRPSPTIPEDPKALEAVIRDREDPLLTVAREIATEVTRLEGRVLLVGGYVRDLLLGDKEPKDLDMEVFGVTQEALRSLLEERYPKRLDESGAQYGIFKLHVSEGVDLDIALPRREVKVDVGAGSDRRRFLISTDPFLSYREAASRRDFTCNAISADPLTGEIIDPYDGVDDLRVGRLRAVDPTRFSEDSLRILRGVQLAARLELEPDVPTFELMHGLVHQGSLSKVSAEKFTSELYKLLLKAEKPSLGFELMHSLGITRRHLPDLEALIGVPNEGGGDVWQHTMRALDTAAELTHREGLSDEERLKVMLGCLCHSLHRPDLTRASEDGGIKVEGSLTPDAIRPFLSAFNLPKAVRVSVITSASLQTYPEELYKRFETGNIDDRHFLNGSRVFVRKATLEGWRTALSVSDAVHRTCSGKGSPAVARVKEAVERYNLDDSTLIQGKDLLELGLKPGKRCRELIDEVEELRDLGVIETKEEALEYVRSTFK